MPAALTTVMIMREKSGIVINKKNAREGAGRLAKTLALRLPR